MRGRRSSLVRAIHFQRSSGSTLSYWENGTIWSALSLPSRRTTLRCRLFPSGFDVHSIADERGEAARLVVLFRRGSHPLPHRLRERVMSLRGSLRLPITAIQLL